MQPTQKLAEKLAGDLMRIASQIREGGTMSNLSGQEVYH